MKRIISVLLVLFIFLICSACFDVKSAKTLSEIEDENFGSYCDDLPEGIPDTAVNMLHDEKFQYGINIIQTPYGKRDMTGYLDYDGNARFAGADNYISRSGLNTIPANRFWSLTQWTSKADFGDEENRVLTVDGTKYTYSNGCKTVIVDPAKGSLTLSANCGEEYDYKERSEEKRQKGEWTHLLIEQYGDGDKYNIGNVKDIYYYLDFSIDEVTKYDVSPKYPSEQRAQLVWYFGFGGPSPTPIWFGLRLFDSYESEHISWAVGETYSFDPGMGYPLYLAPNDEFFDAPLKIGERYIRVMKMTDFVHYCYEMAKKSNVFGDNVKFEDFRLWNMNLGWEVPGTFDVSVTFNRIGVYYDL